MIQGPDIIIRVPVCMCLDISGSMSGHMEALNMVVRKFCKVMKEKTTASVFAEIAQINFGGGNFKENIVRCDPSYTSDGKPEIFQNTEVKVKENTPLGEAVLRALSALEERIKIYTEKGISYAMPVLLLVSDGHGNTDPHALQEAQEKVSMLVEEGKLMFIPVGIGDDIHRLNLQKFSPTRELLSWRNIDFSNLLQFSLRD